MAVAVEGHGDRGVSEEFLHELRMNTAREQQGGFKNGGTSTWSSWKAYQARKSWMLTRGSGKKVVYAQYKDGAGNVSRSAQDSITYRP